eukprot:TRINITY_DN13750_c0_g1_i2.p2 TRINITY_DN13750_c0_g1~~TRINITY_DN13750_c0_g1_i2.p2  ORF type:complete len:102 (+),score=20.25 TRINITY_DN13750_c0_g1_i2:133-438(+)
MCIRDRWYQRRVREAKLQTMSVKAIGWCCSLTSAFAVVFLGCVGAALGSGTELLGEIDGSKSEAATRCYHAAIVYAVFFAGSVVAILFGPEQATIQKKLTM